MMTLNTRFYYFIISLIALSALCAGLFFQYYDHIEPCILCIMQRIVFLILLLLGITVILHNPIKRFFHYFYSGSLLLFSAVGIGVATRQIWLQHIPISQRPLCAPSLDYIFANFPWQETLALFFSGSGDCGEVNWQLFGISMAGWALFLFGIIFVLSLLNILRS